MDEEVFTCRTCGHPDEEHDHLGMCEHPGCKCVTYRGSELDDEEEDFEPLDFDHE